MLQYPDLEYDGQRIHRHYVKHFKALEKAWQNGAADISYHLVARGFQTKIIDFDPNNHDRILVEVRQINRVELYLIDTTQGQSHLIAATLQDPNLEAKFIPFMKNKILLNDMDGLSVVDISSPVNPIWEMITPRLFRKIIIVPGTNAVALISPDNFGWGLVFDEGAYTLKNMMQFANPGASIEQMITSSDYPGIVFTVTKEKIFIWKPDDNNYLKTIDISSVVSWKSAYLHQKKEDTITVLSANGIVTNYKVSTGERMAERDLGIECGRLTAGASLRSDGKRFLVSCKDYTLAIVDAKTLKLKGRVATPGASHHLLPLGAGSKYAITREDRGRLIALVDTEKTKFEGYITRNCGAKLTLKVFACLRPNPVLPVNILSAVVNPWDKQRLLTTNGSELTIWDTEFKQVHNLSVFDPEFREMAEIYINPHNPNKVYALQFNGWLAVVDFWKGAKKLVSNSSL